MSKKSLFVEGIVTECEIEASAARVYSIISDFPNFNKWNDNLVISGDTQPGGKMRVKVNVPGFGWQKFSSRMIKLDANIIAFNNVEISRFLLIGKHRYEIISVSENKTMFINAEIFSGLAIPFLRRMNFTESTRKFKEDTNIALKKAAEAL